MSYRKYIYAFLVMLLSGAFFTFAIAGGGDGTDILGPVKALPKKEVIKQEPDASPDPKEQKENVSPDTSDKEAVKPEKEALPEINFDDSEMKGKAKEEQQGPAYEGNDARIIHAMKKPQEKKKEEGEKIKMDCVATPAMEPDFIMEKPVKRSNNLIRKPGSARRAYGQYIEVKGKVVDENCLPISNAVIEIWQTDSAGKYDEQYALKTKWDVLDKDYDKAFAYSGRAQTNNLGEYAFVTILPAAVSIDNAPHINLRIKHSDFRNIETKMFFNKHPRNNNDKSLIAIEDKERKLLMAKGQKLDPTDKTEGRIYDFSITLEGLSKFERY